MSNTLSNATSAADGGVVPYFITPCGPSYMPNHTVVNASQVINITFGGAPPYNLTKTYYTNGTGYCASGIPGFNETYVLNTTTYQWTVEQPFDLYGKMVNNPGDGVVFVAVEQQARADNASNHNYWTSTNYTVYDAANPSGTQKGGSERNAVKAGLMLGLLAIPALMTICS